MSTENHPGQRIVSRRGFLVGASAVAAGFASRATAAPPASAPAKARLHGTVRVALIGMQGHIGYVLDGVTRIDDCRLAAVARCMPGEAVEKLNTSRAWNAETRIYDDYRKMLDEVRPDVVGIAAPFTRNAETSIEAVRRGCHVMSEKPLATELEDLARLREARDKAGVRVTAMLPMRLGPEYQAARKVVLDGTLGEPVLVSAQKSYRWGTNRADYYRRRVTYGGTIPWVAIHAIDYIRYVTGLEYANVAARHAVKVHKDYPECEDCGALLFEMTNGGQAVLTFDYLRPKEAPSHGDDRLRVVGSKGVVEVRDTNETFCELITADAAPRQLPLPPASRGIFADFVAELRGGPPHVLAPEDPFRATEVSIKARIAADTRTTVPL